MKKQEYIHWEKGQGDKLQEQKTKSFENYDGWQITRYVDNARQYFVYARHELGYKYTAYANIGQWHGGRNYENTVFDELRYFYKDQGEIRITRTEVDWNCKVFEVLRRLETGYWQTITAVMIVDGTDTLLGQQRQLKDGYRYHFSRVKTQKR